MAPLRQLILGLSLLLTQTVGQLTGTTSYQGPEDPRIRTEITWPHPINGVSTTPSGRTFLVISRVDGSMGPAVVEYNSTASTTKPYPNNEWNSYSNGSDPATHFIGINAQRVGPDGKLYVVDKGSPAFGAPIILPDGPKIVRVDLQTNKVDRTFFVGNATGAFSFIDDIRFNPHSNKAYITDAGTPAGLIVLDLDTGGVVRMLNGHPSTMGNTPPSAEGNFLTVGGKPYYIYADQLEVSPDAKWFYYQPCEGGMSRIQTKWIDQAFYNSSLNSNEILGEYVEPFAATPSTGGTAIDAKGNVWVSDTQRQAIWKIAPNGTMEQVVQDPRLLWVDAMWIDSNERLWMPAAQLNRGTPFHNGTSMIKKPLMVYTMDIGVGPSKIDHS